MKKERPRCQPGQMAAAQHINIGERCNARSNQQIKHTAPTTQAGRTIYTGRPGYRCGASAQADSGKARMAGARDFIPAASFSARALYRHPVGSLLRGEA